MYQYYNKLWL